jgi:hypothetical protein
VRELAGRFGVGCLFGHRADGEDMDKKKEMYELDLIRTCDLVVEKKVGQLDYRRCP